MFTHTYRSDHVPCACMCVTCNHVVHWICPLHDLLVVYCFMNNCVINLVKFILNLICREGKKWIMFVVHKLLTGDCEFEKNMQPHRFLVDFWHHKPFRILLYFHPSESQIIMSLGNGVLTTWSRLVCSVLLPFRLNFTESKPAYIRGSLKTFPHLYMLVWIGQGEE